MRTTFNVGFYCRESKKDRKGQAPLEVSIILNGERKFMNLPTKADPKEFNKKRRPPELEETVMIWRKRVDDAIKELLDEGIPLTAEGLREVLRTGGARAYSVGDMFRDGLRLMKGRGMTSGAYRKYELTKEMFMEYIKTDRQLVTIKEDDISGFYEWLEDRYQINSSASYMAKLKTFFKYAIDAGKIRKTPFINIRIRRERKQLEYLTIEEIRRLETTNFSTEALGRIRDMFLIQCYTGLSFIDLECLREEDIQKYENTYYITKRRQKTGILFTAVIIYKGIEILKRYNFKLPIISNQKTNSALKAIAREAGIDKNVYTHLGRKTYGHLLLKNGIRMEAVAKSLGHSDIKTTQRYYAELDTIDIVKEIGTRLK